MTSHLRQRKLNLMAADPHCWYCGTLCRSLPQEPGDRQPDDLATIDHLFTRVLKTRPATGQQVLSCYRCNQDRAAISVVLGLARAAEAANGVMKPSKRRWLIKFATRSGISEPQAQKIVDLTLAGNVPLEAISGPRCRRAES